MVTRRFWRLSGFIMLLLVTLAASTLLVIAAVRFAADLGVIRLQPIEVTSPAIVAAILGVTGLVGIIVAYDKVLNERGVERARFVFDLSQDFLKSDAERDFFYKLDYLDFKFDPDTFAQSRDEMHLDRLLYKLSFVGKLLRDGLVELDDVNNIRHIASRTLRNDHVIAYLRYLKEEQVPDHASFSDAVYLFEKWFGRKDPAYPAIVRYLSSS